MIFTLPVKALSINQAFQGRRFKTNACKQYDNEVSMCLMPFRKNTIKGYVSIHYKFYLKNWKMTDGDNLVKVVQDNIVKSGIIEDDRKILKYVIEKFPVELSPLITTVKECIWVCIEEYNDTF